MSEKRKKAEYPPDCFIQSGGRSSRMGTDKAWLEIDGRPMIERVITAAQPITNNVSIIINSSNPQADRYIQLADQLNARVIYDLHDHRGPLGGIHTALKNCEPDKQAMILACDLPFITTQFLGFLMRCSDPETLVIPVDAEGRLQPLAGIYPASCLSIVEEMLARDILRVDRICSMVGTHQVQFQEYQHLPGARKMLVNINTIEGYRDVV